MADYQMEKTLGKCFRSKSDQFIGTVRILGSPYTYKVIQGIPVEHAMLQVVDYADNYLLVVVDNSLFESDVNFIVNR
ncbi:hypothetical protein ACYSNW_10790 [Enterococcus sp. LJL99]